MIPRLVLAALTLVAVEAPPRPEGRPPSEPLDAVFECYARAHGQTLLDGSQVDELCEGAADAGPVDCYVAARAHTFLGVEDAISLCRCATSPEPVECYREGYAGTRLDPGKIQELCSPTVRRRLGPDCAPEP